MDALAALLSSDFHSSNWTDQEVGFAVGTGRIVLPLRFGLDPYGFIAKYQGYPIAGVSDVTVAEDIVKIFARNGATSLKLAKALVKRLENSHSWDRAKSSMALLEECAVIDEDLLQRIEAVRSIRTSKLEKHGRYQIAFVPLFNVIDISVQPPKTIRYSEILGNDCRQSSKSADAVWAGFQALILRGEQSGSLTRFTFAQNSN